MAFTTTATVIDIAPTLSAVTISGIVQEGQVLTAVGASPNETDDTVTYQWQNGSGNISGATGSTYTVSEADEGQKISVVVTDVTEDGTATTSVAFTTTATVIDIAPTLSAVTISGIVQEGQVLTAVGASPNETDDTVTYQWQNGSGNISGATGSTYTVSEADEGQKISVVVTDVTEDGTATTSVAFTTTATVIDIAPTLSAVTISGIVQEGQVLTAVGASPNETDDTVTYQWQNGSGNISGATGSTYTVSEADEGQKISVVVTDVTEDGTATTSVAFTTTATVIDIAPTLSAVTISGIVQEGQVLTAVGASPNETDDTVTYQWQNGSGNISGATGSTYTVSEADEGQKISVVVTDVTEDGTATTSVAFTTTATVIDIAPTLSAVTISGIVQEGQVLTAVGASPNETDDTVTYQWQNGSGNISGATGSTYTVSEADEGQKISVVVTDVTEDGTATTSVAFTTTATVIDIAPTLSAVTISGIVQEGQVLTAVGASPNETDDTVTYQWQNGSGNISGATGSTYTVSEADEGQKISVVVTDVTEDGTATTSVAFTTTATVIDIAPTLSAVTISGIVQEGQVLTAVGASPNETDDTVTYQWQNGSGNISGATGSTYTVSEADEGQKISVVVTDVTEDGTATTSVAFTTTATVIDIAPTLSAVTISGIVQEGQVLTAVGASPNETDDTVTYQWQNGSGNISGATGSTYTVSEADEGQKISVVVTDVTEDGTATTSVAFTTTATVIDIAPTLSAVTISGIVQEGQVLTAVGASPNETDDTVTYQWQNGSGNISGATGSTYTVSEADEGQKISVVVTDVTEDGTATTSVAFTTTATVIDIAPTLSAVTISGIVQEGQVLTAVGASPNETDDTVTYQWQNGSGNISGATGSTYTVSEADEGQKISVVVTDVTEDGTATTSVAFTTTATVIDIAPTLSAVTISGIVQEGQVLTAVGASPNETDDTVTYQWQNGSGNISGATGSTYTVSEADEGQKISVVVTDVTEDGTATTSVAFTTTATVIDIAPTLSAVTISGIVQEGQVLTAVGASPNETDDTVTYQWQSGGTNISGATGSTYTVSETDEGKKISVVVTDTADFGGGTTSVAFTTATTVIDVAPTLTSVSITGTAQEGQVLTAHATANEADDPLTYQWQSGGTNIAGATASTYTVRETDETKTITVVVTDTADNGGGSTSVTSAATTTVIDIAPTLTNVSITGTAQEGQVLTAVGASPNETDDPLTYQWQSAGTAISGATNATYTVSEADEGNAISVVITDTADNGGGSTSVTSAATTTVIDIAPTLTNVSITGTAQEGQVLTAHATANEADDPLTYQWKSGGTNIAGATASTYTVSETDETKTITVVVTDTADNGGGSTSVTSAATTTVIDVAPTLTNVSITGTAQEGQVLTAHATANEADDPLTYQWKSGGTNIAGATASTYTVSETDETKTITVVVTDTADNGGGSTSVTSAATTTVLDVAPTLTNVSITGTAQEGQVLTAHATANEADDPLTYQWQSGGTNIAGATASTYTVSETDETKTITVVVTDTADNGGGSTSVTSAATTTVIDVAPTLTNVSITGTAQEGQVLTAHATANEADDPLTYQWQSGGTNISGATNSTYTVSEADETKTITVVVTDTADNGGGSTSVTSAATTTVIDVAPTLTNVSITGTAQEGQVLTAHATANEADDPLTYQWKSGGTNIAGATASTYTVSETDETKTITVVVTDTADNGGGSTSVTSAATGTVSDITLAFTTAASITGTAQEGQVLTAVNGTLNDSDAAVTGYQWTSNGTNISGATSSTYLVKEADEGAVIRVVETATDSDGGPTATSTSAATGTVSDITLAFTTAASITGTAQEGQTLTAVNGTLNDSDAAVTGYQWTKNGTNISGATSSTYLVKEADEGAVIRVVETATDSDGGPTTTSTSAATSAVTDISLLPTITAGTNTQVSGNAWQVTFNVTFPEAVATVGTNDFTLFGTATTSSSPPSIASISGSGTSYTVTVDYAENKNAGHSLGLNFVNTGSSVHDTETGESGNLAVATNITTAQFGSLSPAGIAGTPINLALNDASGVSALTTVTVGGVPADWSLSAGTNNGDGTWTVQTSDPSALSVTTPVSYSGAMVLNVAETWTNADGSMGSLFVSDNVEAYAQGSPIFALSGNDTLTGAGANDEFVFSQPIGIDVIYSFNVASDKVDLIGFNNVANFSDIQANLTDDAYGNAVITIGNGETITLNGVDAASLTASDFVFNQTPVTQNASSMVISDGAILPLSGVVNNTGTIALNSTGDGTNLELIQNGITLQGGGALTLSDNSANAVFGTDPSVVFTNVDNTISGAGQLGEGQMTLVNEGTIDASGTSALVLDTGSNVISNSGTLEATGAGGLIVNSAVANSGSLLADGGNLTFTGAVTGNGSATISGAATLEFAAASAENVNFAAGSTGTLKLDDSAEFTGSVSGLTTTTYIDLADLSWAQGQMIASFSGDTSGGKLTVSDGTHSDTINLAGDYTQSGWTLSQDSAGNTLVVDPPLASAPIIGVAGDRSTMLMAQYAAAGFQSGVGGGTGGYTTTPAPEAVFEPPSLTKPT